jgi:hypothetical protein
MGIRCLLYRGLELGKRILAGQLSEDAEYVSSLSQTIARGESPEDEVAVPRRSTMADCKGDESNRTGGG